MVEVSRLSQLFQHPSLSWLRVNTCMIPSKLTYFFYYCQVGSCGYYNTLFFTSIGLSMVETGFITGLTLFGFTVFGPLFGLLVDYTGRRKLMFLIFMTLDVLLVFSMPFASAAINSRYHCNNKTSLNSTSVHQYIGTSHNSTVHHNGCKPFKSPLFITILLLDVLSKVFKSPLHAMVDAAVVNVIEKKEPTASFGAQRLFGSLSFGMASLISGFFIHHFGGYFKKIGLSEYTVMHFLSLFFAIICIVVCLLLLNQMDLEVPTKSKKNVLSGNKLKILITTFSNIQNMVFLLTWFVVGTCNMTLAGFLFKLMKDQMKATKRIMGMCTLVQSIVQLLVFPFADKIIKMLGGEVVAMEVAVFSFLIRYVANAYIINPYFVLLTQLIHCLGFSLFWAAAVVYTRQITPKEIFITTFTVVNCFYFGLGGTVAHMLGGVIYSSYGGSKLFFSCGLFCGIWTIIMLAMFQGYEYFRNFSSRRGRVYPGGLSSSHDF